MKYEVRGTLLGFDEMLNVEIHKIDEMFSTMTDCENEKVTFTIVNPFELREYSFDLPSDIKVLLDIQETSKIEIYNIVVIDKNLEESTVNFLAPILVNTDNKKIAQVVLNSQKHPEFGMAESIKSFYKE
ncbi:MAG: flagellar assembly protein FliW [Epsilonproteobacteria bacterium]|nr:MAG: flagellar assembly protein FliW [Campylobacterota bacterium]